MKICEPSRPAQCGHATHTTANKSTKASHQNSLLPPLLFSIVVNSGSAGVCRASGPHSFSPLFFFLSYLILCFESLLLRACFCAITMAAPSVATPAHRRLVERGGPDPARLAASLLRVQQITSHPESLFSAAPPQRWPRSSPSFRFPSGWLQEPRAITSRCSRPALPYRLPHTLAHPLAALALPLHVRSGQWQLVAGCGLDVGGSSLIISNDLQRSGPPTISPT